MDRKSLMFLLFIFFFISLLLYWTVFLTQPNPGNGGNEGENEVDLGIDETQFFQVPEYPLGTILALIACLVALGVYSKSRHFTDGRIPKSQQL